MKVNRVWYSNKVDPRSPDSIHQILMFGTLEEIQNLKETIGEDTVRHLFLSNPKKVYTAPALNFIKNFVLGINTSIDEQKYLKNRPRHTR